MKGDQPIKIESAQASAVAKAYTQAAAPDSADYLAPLGTPVDFSQEAEPLSYLVEGLPFASGGKVNALAGPPKGGKSPFALALAICVASGLPFLGRRILRQGPVLYLDAETGRLAHIRYRRICRSLGVDAGAVPLTFLNVDTTFSPKYCSDLEIFVEASRPQLVVIDTYGAMLEAGVDYNSPDFAFYLKQLGRLSRRLDVVIIVLIHEKKSGGGRSNGLEMISGSYAASGALQGVVSLRPEGEGNDSPIVVSCSRAPEDDFQPFRMRWIDVASPDAATPGARLATEGKRWGLAAELVEGAPAPLVSPPKAAQDEDTSRRIYAHLAKGPSAMRGIRDAVAASFAAEGRKGVGKERLELLVGKLVELGTVRVSAFETSGRDHVLYGLRDPVG